MSNLLDPRGNGGPSLERLPTDRYLPVSHSMLWTVVLIATVFDIVTTSVGLQLGLREGNAIANAFMATYGIPYGIGLMKFVALVFLVFLWSYLPENKARYALKGFAVVSLFTVALNTVTLVTY